MGIRRSALAFEEKFTRIPNEWARDARLSRRARGLLVEIMSHRVGWHVTIRSLAASGKEGRDAIQTALSELLEHGYVRRSQGRASAGKFGEIEYELCDPQAVAGFPVHGSTASGSAVSGESVTKKTISSEDHQREVLSDLLDVLWMMWPASRRSTRKVVEKSLGTALKSTDAPTLIEAVNTHTDVWSTWPPSEVQYVPLLSTWLNQERWTGAAPEPRTGRQLSPVDMGRAAAELLAVENHPHLRALS